MILLYILSSLLSNICLRSEHKWIIFAQKHPICVQFVTAFFTSFSNIRDSFLPYNSSILSILIIDLSKFFFPIYIWFIKCIHRPATQIVTSITEITCSTALIETFLDDPYPLLSCRVLDEYTFYLHNLTSSILKFLYLWFMCKGRKCCRSILKVEYFCISIIGRVHFLQ